MNILLRIKRGARRKREEEVRENKIRSRLIDTRKKHHEYEYIAYIVNSRL